MINVDLVYQVNVCVKYTVFWICPYFQIYQILVKTYVKNIEINIFLDLLVFLDLAISDIDFFPCNFRVCKEVNRKAVMNHQVTTSHLVMKI